MVDADATLSIRRQCELLSVSRSGLYYEPVPTSAEELALMRRMDERHLKWPFHGSRKVSQALAVKCSAASFIRRPQQLGRKFRR
jgi:putative transposase